MYRFLLRPKWMAGHVAIAAVVLGCLALGLWQLDRLEQRRAYNALVAERSAAPPRPLEALAADGWEGSAYRRVEVAGEYDEAGQLLLSTRTHRGRAGHHVLTPLRAGDGTVVVVDRGWVPLEWDGAALADAAPPDGPVRVSGMLFPSEQASRSGSFRGDGDRLEFVSAVDVPRIEAAYGRDLAPLWLLAEGQEPAPGGELPVPAEPPELDEGNHLSYAGQWFFFAAIAAVGYPLLVRRSARDEAAAGDGSPSDDEAVRAGGPG